MDDVDLIKLIPSLAGKVEELIQKVGNIPIDALTARVEANEADILHLQLDASDLEVLVINNQSNIAALFSVTGTHATTLSSHDARITALEALSAAATNDLIICGDFITTVGASNGTIDSGDWSVGNSNGGDFGNQLGGTNGTHTIANPHPDFPVTLGATAGTFQLPAEVPGATRVLGYVFVPTSYAAFTGTGVSQNEYDVFRYGLGPTATSETEPRVSSGSNIIGDSVDDLSQFAVLAADVGTLTGEITTWMTALSNSNQVTQSTGGSFVVRTFALLSPA